MFPWMEVLCMVFFVHVPGFLCILWMFRKMGKEWAELMEEGRIHEDDTSCNNET